MLAFERNEALVTVMARIDVENYESISSNAEIGLRCSLPPEFDLPTLCGGVEQTFWREFAIRMFRGVVAAWPAAQIAAAGADCPAVVCDGPIDRQHGVTVAGKGERGGER